MQTIAKNTPLALTLSNCQKRAALMAALKKEQDADLALLAAAAHETGTVEVEGVGTYIVSENNTYEVERIEAALSPGQVKRCMVATLDKAVVKRLYPNVYAAAKVNKGRKVTLR